MSENKVGKVFGPLDHVVLFVPDVDEALPEYTEKLGFDKEFGGDGFAKITSGDGPWIGLHESETGRTGEPPIAYFRVDDIRSSMNELLEAGLKVGNFHEVPGGLIATAWDSAGNPLGLFQEK